MCYRQPVEPFFTPLVHTGEWPTNFASPFDEVGPPPLARQAAAALQHELAGGWLCPGVSTAPLFEDAGGKMFGILVVTTSTGRVGFLRAFSGMLAGGWDLPGYVPPIFDRQARAAFEPEAEALVKALHQRRLASAQSADLASARQAAAQAHDSEAAALAALRHQHAVRKRQRQQRRTQLLRDGESDTALAALHQLDQQSRADKAERRHLVEELAADRQTVVDHLTRCERRLAAHDRLCRYVSRRFMRRIHDTYSLTNGLGETTELRHLYAPAEPPSGAADCAAPKLLAFAHAHRLRPLALAEFWFGASPATGGRVSGAFYPACRDKCGPLLPFLLRGLRLDEPRRFQPPPAPKTGLDIVYQDQWLVVIDKPAGLLSVPGRTPEMNDSVLQRLREQYPQAQGPLIVHRLDLDTSGLLVAALDTPTYVALQRQFTERSVHKRYIAWVEGEVHGESGAIELALRVDRDDRPRQIHDPLLGKPAHTDWRVLTRTSQRTRVELRPHTGRTHQLRVHAAHPQGLAAAIVGDRLYGHPGERLLLHAESLTLTHPATGEVLSFVRPAPF